MSKVTIYTTPTCGYCAMAKRLLQTKVAGFTEIDVSRNPAARQTMEERAGRYTVPQIWIGDRHVGGCDDLYALDNAGKLDSLLAD